MGTHHATPSVETFELLLGLALLPQPPAARLAAASRVTLATAGRLTKHLIRLISRVPGGVSYLPRKIDISMLNTCYHVSQVEEAPDGYPECKGHGPGSSYPGRSGHRPGTGQPAGDRAGGPGPAR